MLILLHLTRGLCYHTPRKSRDVSQVSIQYVYAVCNSDPIIIMKFKVFLLDF